ncbi:hypothetical protein GGI05_004632, partial [Coemansia sp. RSA 2603]
GWGPLSPSRPVDFTTCFQHGFFVAGLNALFILVAGLRLHRTRHASLLPPEIVAQSSFWFKLFVAAAALVASAIELFLLFEQQLLQSVYGISLMLQTVATAIALRLHFREQFTNRIASTPLLLFWFATVLLSLMRLRTSIAMDLISTNAAVVVATGAFMLAALGVLTMECQPKPSALYNLPYDDEDDVNDLNGEIGLFGTSPAYGTGGYAFQSLEERSNIFSQMTFTWMTPLLEKGFQ